jgi:hypothetical protein
MLVFKTAILTRLYFSLILFNSFFTFKTAIKSLKLSIHVLRETSLFLYAR